MRGIILAGGSGLVGVYAWLDTGTQDSLQDAGAFIRTIETRTGIKICCPEEVTFQADHITAEDMLKRAALLGKTNDATYLRQGVDGQDRY